MSKYTEPRQFSSFELCLTGDHAGQCFCWETCVEHAQGLFKMVNGRTPSDVDGPAVTKWAETLWDDGTCCDHCVVDHRVVRSDMAEIMADGEVATWRLDRELDSLEAAEDALETARRAVVAARQAVASAQDDVRILEAEQEKANARHAEHMAALAVQLGV